MLEYLAYQLNTDLSRAAEGTGPVKPDNLRTLRKVPNPAGNRKIRVQRSELRVLSAFIFALENLNGMLELQIHTLL